MGDMLSYDDVCSHFVPEGTFRDVYALETTDAEWLAVLNQLVAREWISQLWINGEASGDVAKAVSTIHSHCDNAYLEVSVRGVMFRCLFYDEHQIEFYFEPEDINRSTFATLCDFVAVMSDATGRNVFVSEEGGPRFGIFVRAFESRTLQMLKRPRRPTRLSHTIGSQVRELIWPFNQLQLERSGVTVDGWPDPADVIGCIAAAHRFRKELYRPDTLEWHTDLTEAVYAALDELDNSFAIFFGDQSFDEFCRLSGATVSSLRRQFWESLARAWQAFSHGGEQP